MQSNGRRDALLSLTVLAVMACAAPAAGQARAVGPRLGTFTGRESGPVSAWVVGLEAGYAFGRRLEVSGELAAWDSWGVDCLPESRSCRVAGTTLLLAVATGAGLSSNAALRLIGSVGRYDAALGSGAPAVGVGAAADLILREPGVADAGRALAQGTRERLRGRDGRAHRLPHAHARAAGGPLNPEGTAR